MTLYLDASALAKRYIRESESGRLALLLAADQQWVAGNHTLTEVSIVLGRRLADADRLIALTRLGEDWRKVTVVDLDEPLCQRAADVGIELRLRTLDALHLAAAERAGGPELTFVTFDARLAEAARAMGFPVAGV